MFRQILVFCVKPSIEVNGLLFHLPLLYHEPLCPVSFLLLANYILQVSLFLMAFSAYNLYSQVSFRIGGKDKLIFHR